jgi:O-acetyl-ADP-ribose deacetylase (regulator of RNase III)
MITEKNGDLLEANDIDVAIHQTNLFHTFGAGIAKQIKEKFPNAYKADLATKKGDKNKLGTYSFAFDNGKYIVNMYAQDGFAKPGKPATDYVAFKKAIIKIENHFVGKVIGVPHGIGCGLAGGNWNIVRAILDDVFLKKGNLVIYKL